MKNIAVYAGTFDPITLGHIDVVTRAQGIFDQILVAVVAKSAKNPLFSWEDRIALCKQALADKPKVEVHGFDNLLVDFAKQHQANVILRGLRTVTDFDYEFQLASTNRCLSPQIESVFLMPAERYMHISSTLVREIAMLKGDVSSFVPAIVQKALQSKCAT